MTRVGWSRDYEACVACDKTDYPFQANGLCTTCYAGKTFHGERKCDACTNQLPYRNFTPLRYSRVWTLCEKCSSEYQNRQWTFGYDRCWSCKENDSPHRGSGLCRSCWVSEYRYGLRTCEWCRNEETRRSFSGAVLCSKKCKKELVQAIAQLSNNGHSVIDIANNFSRCREFVTTRLRGMGIYTRHFVKRTFGSIYIITQQPHISGQIQYFTDEKQAIRELMAEETAMALKLPLQLVSLPHANMADIVEFAEWCKINPPESLAVEKNRKWFNMMSSWVNAATSLPDGSIIRGLRLYRGQLSRALAEVPGTYNCANLDFDGIWASETQTSLRNLFTYQRLAEDAVLFVTVTNAEKYKYRSNTAFDPQRGQEVVIPKGIASFAYQNGYHSELLWGMTYKETTPSPMLTLAFRIRKVREVRRDDDCGRDAPATAELWCPQGAYQRSEERSPCASWVGLPSTPIKLIRIDF